MKKIMFKQSFERAKKCKCQKESHVIICHRIKWRANVIISSIYLSTKCEYLTAINNKKKSYTSSSTATSSTVDKHNLSNSVDMNDEKNKFIERRRRRRRRQKEMKNNKHRFVLIHAYTQHTYFYTQSHRALTSTATVSKHTSPKSHGAVRNSINRLVK